MSQGTVTTTILLKDLATSIIGLIIGVIAVYFFMLVRELSPGSRLAGDFPNRL